MSGGTFCTGGHPALRHWHKVELDDSDSSSIVSPPDCDEHCSDFSLDCDTSLEAPLEQSFNPQSTSNITQCSAEATTLQEGNYRVTVMIEGVMTGNTSRKGNHP